MRGPLRQQLSLPIALYRLVLTCVMPMEQDLAAVMRSIATIPGKSTTRIRNLPHNE